MSLRAALIAVAALGASGACTLDHPIGQTGAGGSAGGICGGATTGGGAGGSGGGSAPTPIDECDPTAAGACTAQGQHCVDTPDSTCPDGLCRGWCMPPQTRSPTMCGTGLAACPVGMACLKDPIASCDPFAPCGCEGLCYGVDLQATVLLGSCAPDGGSGCVGTDHCVADPAACEADAGSCAGVCVPSAQPAATACGPWPDFGCPSGTHCVKNPNHDCALPLDCPGLCWPN